MVAKHTRRLATTDDDLFSRLIFVVGGAQSPAHAWLFFWPPPGGCIPPERWGMGIMASGTLMMLPQLYLQAPTNFTGWAATVFWFGALVKFSARAFRAIRHKVNNSARHRGWRGAP